MVQSLIVWRKVVLSPKVCTLQPYPFFIDVDSLLHVRCRLSNVELPYSERHSVIDPNGHLALLMIRFQQMVELMLCSPV